MKHILTLTTLSAAALLAVAACSKTGSEPANPNAGKELISFSGEGGAATKVGFTTTTYVKMHVKAEAAGKAPRYTEALASALACGTEDYSVLQYTSGQERYWDDAYGRDSKLTVYAFAIPGNVDGDKLPVWSQTGWEPVSATTNPNWNTDDSEDNTVSWSVKTVQNTDEILSLEDLTFSNNIRVGGKDGLYTYSFDGSAWVEAKGDGVMVWRPKTDAAGETSGKFDKGHLIFEHALAKIEINLKEGAGFNNEASTDFTWTKKLSLVGVNTQGTFNVSTGTWSEQTSGTITEMFETTGTPAAKTVRQLTAYVIPGNNLYETASNVLEFEIDNAKYYVTGKQIAEAIRSYDYGAEGQKYASFETIEGGKYYIINLSVAKKSIDRITAAVVDWEKVNSDDAVAQNTYVSFSLEDRGTRFQNADASKFNLFRSAKTAANYIDGVSEPNYDWASGYEGPAVKTWNGDAAEWKTGWFWENNLTYYHFRAAGNTEEAAVALVNDNVFNITSGALSGSSYKDYLWGAPFKNVDETDKLTYSTVSGFDNETSGSHQISQAIASTKSLVNMLLFHVTSQVFVDVKTTTDASKVVLEDGAKKTKVEILNFLADGQVLMGNGLVETTSADRTAAAEMTYGTYSAESAGEPAKITGFSYGIVPQALGTIGLRITTPDGNQYVVKDMSQCTGTVSNTNLTIPYTGSPYKIDAWYPHYQYSYTVIVKKTGIERITAAVLPWETVTGDLGTIDLEN